MKWICAQIGARERYFVSRSLHRVGALELLLTDAWFRPGDPWRKSNARLAGRYDPALADAGVQAPNWSYLAFEALHRLRKTPKLDTMIARNAWFQRHALQRLRHLAGTEPRVMMAYSYAAKDLFAYAKQRGWRTVLNQIDLGPFEEELVARLEPDHLAPRWPAGYWQDWREELDLADLIVVNSAWSRDALIAQGVGNERIRILPLVYDGPHQRIAPRSYPDKFGVARPMRVLFLGQVIARKGMVALFQAIRELEGQPIHFDIVGPIGMVIPDDIRRNPRVTMTGSVPHAEASRFYHGADVFILPTLSDGFAITQLEARYLRLPVIASRFCGAVVEHGVNGLILDAVDAPAIVAALRRCLGDPGALQRMSDAEDWQFSEVDMGNALLKIHENVMPIAYTDRR
jgi:glycosyltransferase involved in cell wall biosynthesis